MEFKATHHIFLKAIRPENILYIQDIFAKYTHVLLDRDTIVNRIDNIIRYHAINDSLRPIHENHVINQTLYTLIVERRNYLLEVEYKHKTMNDHRNFGHWNYTRYDRGAMKLNPFRETGLVFRYF
jgi:hypothetical protein